MTNRLLKITLIAISACVGIHAQTTGPLHTTFTSSGYPAKTCTNFPNNVCVLVQACPWGDSSCSDNTPGGGHDPSVGGSGGLGNFSLAVTTNGGSPATMYTNSNGISQGFVVLLGSTFTTWSITHNLGDGNPCGFTVLNNGFVSSTSKSNWNTGNTYYKVLMACQ
jgi:hypothetical protein